jgi:hypothetical protein
VIALVDDNVDFSQFDLVFIIHAGAGQETDTAGDSPIQIWSSFYDRGDIRARRATRRAPALPPTTRKAPAVLRRQLCHRAGAGVAGYRHHRHGWASGPTRWGAARSLIPLFDFDSSGPDSQGVGGFA